MKDNNDLTGFKISEKVWLKHIRAAIPLIILLIVILALGFLIKSKSNFLNTMKKEVRILEGMKIATQQDKVGNLITIFQSSKNSKDATKKLMKQFGLSKRQAQAIAQMPLDSFTKIEQQELENNINTIKKNIAANKDQRITGRPSENVVTMMLTPRTIRDRINLPGIVDPWIKLDVLSEVSGEVITKAVKEGDTVNKGDIIAIIDSRKYENNYASAKALYESALASRKRLTELHKEELSTTSQLDNAVAQTKSHKADMDNAKLDLENCRVRARVSGIVNRIDIEEGQYLSKSTKIAQILQIKKVKVNVGIPESDVDAVRKLDHFDVKIDALGAKVFKGTKHYLSKSADPDARLYNLAVTIDNAEGKILPDMFARVEIVKNIAHNSIIMPIYSLISYDNGHIVYVAKDGTSQMRQVETGMQEGWQIEITKGLSPGEEIIVVGHRSVSDGQKINVVRTVKDPEELTR
jgi:membrane fusion protein (multidrug efflux system)